MFQLVLKTLKHFSFSRDQMQFEIDSIFQIEKISSGENIIFSRGSSGFSKISYSKFQMILAPKDDSSTCGMRHSNPREDQWRNVHGYGDS